MIDTEGGGGKQWELRVLPGPGDPASMETHVDVADNQLQRLLGRSFEVLPRSDRMAVCLALDEGAPCHRLCWSREPAHCYEAHRSEACIAGVATTDEREAGLLEGGQQARRLAKHANTSGSVSYALLV
jgi:hypothetical protein